MKKPERSQVMLLCLGLALLAAAYVFFFRGGDARPAPSSSGYYGGPMMNKSRTGYGDDNGHMTPAPASESAVKPIKNPNVLN